MQVVAAFLVFTECDWFMFCLQIVHGTRHVLAFCPTIFILSLPLSVFSRTETVHCFLDIPVTGPGENGTGYMDGRMVRFLCDLILRDIPDFCFLSFLCSCQAPGGVRISWKRQSCQSGDLVLKMWAVLIVRECYCLHEAEETRLLT